jgi:transposase
MNKIAEIWDRVQRSLFPHLSECLPDMTDEHMRLATILEVIRIEGHVPPSWIQRFGRKKSDRKALARAFIAKVTHKIPTTKALVERLLADKNMRALCGWEYPGPVPSESTFSRAFERFARTGLADQLPNNACIGRVRLLPNFY